MIPLDLTASPLDAAIRRRSGPVPMSSIVWIFVECRGSWCVLRSADPGGMIRTLCCDEIYAEPVCIVTRHPHNGCPACETELAAGTPGAAVAVVVDDTASSRVPTIDLRRPGTDVDPVAAWDDCLFGELEP